MNKDITFNVRLLSMLRDIFPDYPLSAQICEEEYEYIVYSVCRKLREQMNPDNISEEDKQYFNNLCKNYKSADDIIKWIGSNREDWMKYMTAQKFVK